MSVQLLLIVPRHEMVPWQTTKSQADTPAAAAPARAAMLDGMKQLAKDCPVEVEGGIGKTWGTAK